MKRIDDNTIELIHELIDRYFEAQTSAEEEKLLRQIIVSIDISTEKIDRCRAVMGLFAAQRTAGKNIKANVSKRIAILRYAAAAAVFVAIVTISIFAIQQPQPTSMAWINGEYITDEQAVQEFAASQIREIANMNDDALSSIRESIYETTYTITSSKL